MRSFLLHTLVAASAIVTSLLLPSCIKDDIEPISTAKENGLIITFEEASNDSTRTAFHDKTIWWSSDDEVTFGQYALVNSEMTYKSTSIKVTSDREKLSATITSFNTPDDGSDSYYFSVYPKSSFTNYSTQSGHIRARINTPDIQYPTSSSFDPKADLLISNYADNLTKNAEGKYSVILSYSRQVAIGKMTIKNLPSQSRITAIEFSAEKNSSPVTLAGTKWYDFTTGGPTSVYSRKNTLTDYSSQNISNDMIAYFCCYPFELGSGDSFLVKVTTEDGSTYSKHVTLSSQQSLLFEADRGTQFSVNMSSSKKTDNWISVEEYSSSTQVKTADRIYFKITSTADDISSAEYCVIQESVFDATSSLDQLSYNHSLSESLISKLASTGVLIIFSGLLADTSYVVVSKITLSSGIIGYGFTRIHTDWFLVEVATRSNGGIKFRYKTKNLSSETRYYRFIATDSITEDQYESYYTSTLSPGGFTASALQTINDTQGDWTGWYYVTKYHTGKSTTTDMIPSTNYTYLIKVVNTRGETKFVSATATAGGE